MSYIQIKNIWKSYGDNVVLERLNKNVEQGEFVTLVGASGCGKTTFLKMLLGVEIPSKGSIKLEGQPLKAEPDGERGIVFQRYSVFPHLTVRENVLVGLELQQSRWLGRLFGGAKAKALLQVDAMLDRVGLTPAAQRYPHELSGGMQQRLALAQALVAKPKVLLLDEPFGALDPGIRADMHTLVRELWAQEKLTVFMITHDLSEAFALGSRLWVFDKVRHDPQAPNAYGASITYDLPIHKDNHADLAQQLDPELTTVRKLA
ncbi:ABC transporter ATP-binding protein [Corallincola holothuriorum]|uniref:ABC transporter ATP-binding protein n=1 Tax=Corallincola holothuriorum TaxID=2282215 RepID=A0A368N5L2_9GAMM|nr:ABC transporter ATP-binding protein [Corallincola holothuriorum]RCU45293.1 ABC transporter ATP-binding protein [Corallincola holothuriorum]